MLAIKVKCMEYCCYASIVMIIIKDGVTDNELF